jgi:hypothetical protein
MPQVLAGLQPATTIDGDHRLFDLRKHKLEYDVRRFECRYCDAIASREVCAGVYFLHDDASYDAGYKLGETEVNRWLGKVGVLPAKET